MSQQDLNKVTPSLEHRVASIERRLAAISAQSQGAAPPTLDQKFEIEQEAHQEAIQAYQTERLGPQNLSLNGLATGHYVEAGLDSGPKGLFAVLRG